MEAGRVVHNLGILLPDKTPSRAGRLPYSPLRSINVTQKKDSIGVETQTKKGKEIITQTKVKLYLICTVHEGTWGI
jgi:hypothetical protein